MFSIASVNCLPSVPKVWMAIARIAGQRPEAEGADEHQREYQVGNGAAEFEDALDAPAQPLLGARLAAAKKAIVNAPPAPNKVPR